MARRARTLSAMLLAIALSTTPARGRVPGPATQQDPVPDEAVAAFVEAWAPAATDAETQAELSLLLARLARMSSLYLDSALSFAASESITHERYVRRRRVPVLTRSVRSCEFEYLLGWSRRPEEASRVRPREPGRVLLWHANYHPDGGQLFFPLDGQPFVCPLALPGDDVRPEDFRAFLIEGGRGLYIHPDVWHEAVFPLGERGRFHDEQGAVHARVSVDFPREFGLLLSVPLAS